MTASTHAIRGEDEMRFPSQWVVGVGYEFPDPKDLTPEQNAPFKPNLLKDCSPLGFFPCSKDPAALDLVGKWVVATYVLEAQNDEYNIVPEFSSPILLPLPVLVIALALVFSTKRFPRKLLIPDLSANQEIIYTDSRRDSSPLGAFEKYVDCRRSTGAYRVSGLMYMCASSANRRRGAIPSIREASAPERSSRNGESCIEMRK